MADLYKDIDWTDYLEKTDIDSFEFMKELRSQCRDFESTKEFRDAEIKKPVLNTAFSNFILRRDCS